MTIEEILAKLQEISTLGETRSLTDEEVTEYEELEGKLKAAQKTAELRSRTAAYVAPNASLAAVVNVGSVKATDDDELQTRSFGAYLRTGGKPDLVDQLPADYRSALENRAQLTTTGAAGGFAVPETLAATITKRLKSFGGLQNVVRTITTDSGEPYRWPTFDDVANVGVIVAEGAAPASGGADLVLSEKTLPVFTTTTSGAGQAPIAASVELLQDSAFDVEHMIFEALAERVARKEALDWVTGNGTTEPLGIDTGTTYNGFAGAAPTYAELVDAVHQVDPAYRMGASWTFNDYTLGLIEKIVDSTGRPILNSTHDGIAAGPDNQRLLGYPVQIEQAWQNYADGGTSRWGAFGNLTKGYVIRRVSGIHVIANPYSKANQGIVEFTMRVRAGGVPDETNAYRVLINAA